MRAFFGFLLGAIVTAGVITGFGYLCMRLQPWPAGLDYRLPRDLDKYIETAPAGVLWCVLGAWALGPLFGGWVAAKIGKPHRGGVAVLIGAIITVAVIASAAFVRQPDWLPVAGMLLPIPLALLAWRGAIPRAEL